MLKDISNVHEAIEEACKITALAYHSIGDYTEPSDGFCLKCPLARSKTFRNKGQVLDYVRMAVVEKLKRDGYTIADGYDPETGIEIPRDQLPAIGRLP